ncbi:phosphatase PAP2 family protein [Helicobacter cetorum]|uniref:phosphatase PAP2 family protein n=1 Tax=Helicobacter cetorum TaxID=138563 RepID=UPI000CF03CFD|nr:phosphatase PAP2 family protein [Helicobacter cetorum]
MPTNNTPTSNLSKELEKPLFYTQVKSLLILGAIFLGLFGIITCLVHFNHVSPFDNAIFNVVRSHPFDSNPTLAQIVNYATFLGSSKLILPLSLLVGIFLALYRKNLVLGVWFLLSVILAVAIGKYLKILIMRDRPNPSEWLSNPHGYSFPSGHSLSSAIFYGLIILLLPHFISHQKIRNALTYSLLGLVLLMGLARIYLGVHYPSDVLGGFCLGALCASFSVGAYLGVFKKF